MATFVITDSTTGEVRLMDADPPASFDLLLPVGDYKVRRASAEATTLLSIDERINAQPPILTIPSLATGQVVTLGTGSWTGRITLLEKRILVAGVVVATGTAASLTYTTVGGDAEKSIVGEERATWDNGAVSEWVPSNSLIIPGTVFVQDVQWTLREGIVPGDAATPRRTVASTAIAPPAGKVWFVYRSTTPSPAVPTSGVVTAMAGAGPYTFLSDDISSQGLTVFVRIAYGNADKTGLVWGSNERSHGSSTIPIAWDALPESGGGTVSLVAGPAIGEITLRIGNFPADGGQPLTTFFLGQDEAPLADTASLATGDRVFTFTEADPYNPILRSFDLRVSNANGDGAIYRLTGRALADTIAATAPVITNLDYNTGTDEITLDSDQAGDFRLMFESNATARTGAYIKTNLAAASAKIGPVSIIPGLNTISGLDLSGLTAGTWYMKPAVENAGGVSSAAVTPVSVSITAAAPSLEVVQTLAISDQNFTKTKSLPMPATTISGRTLVMELFLSCTLGSLPASAPSGWTSRLKAAGASGCVWLLSKVSDGTEGGTNVTFTTTNNALIAGFVRDLSLGVGDIDVAAMSITLDPEPLTPAAGGTAERLWFTAVSNTNSNGTYSTAPTSFSNLVNAISPAPGSASSGHVKCASAYRQSVLASIDPDTWPAPTSPGAVRGSITWSAR